MILKSLGETRRWAQEFSVQVRAGDVVFLRGPLGAGKTTLAQALAGALGVTEPVTSPTYTIINEYFGKMRLVHMDLYRLAGPDEFELVGGWDAMTKDSVALVEWPERLDGSDLTPTWEIVLALRGDHRSLTLLGPSRNET